MRLNPYLVILYLGIVGLYSSPFVGLYLGLVSVLGPDIGLILTLTVPKSRLRNPKSIEVHIPGQDQLLQEVSGLEFVQCQDQERLQGSLTSSPRSGPTDLKSPHLGFVGLHVGLTLTLKRIRWS